MSSSGVYPNVKEGTGGGRMLCFNAVGLDDTSITSWRYSSSSSQSSGVVSIAVPADGCSPLSTVCSCDFGLSVNVSSGRPGDSASAFDSFCFSVSIWSCRSFSRARNSSRCCRIDSSWRRVCSRSYKHWHRIAIHVNVNSKHAL